MLNSYSLPSVPLSLFLPCRWPMRSTPTSGKTPATFYRTGETSPETPVTFARIDVSCVWLAEPTAVI